MTCIDCGAPCGLRRNGRGAEWFDKRIERCRSCSTAWRHRQGLCAPPPELTPELRAKLSLAATTREAKRHGRQPLTPDVKAQMREAYRNGESQLAIARRMKLSTWTVWNIVSNKKEAA